MKLQHPEKADSNLQKAPTLSAQRFALKVWALSILKFGGWCLVVAAGIQQLWILSHMTLLNCTNPLEPNSGAKI